MGINKNNSIILVFILLSAFFIVASNAFASEQLDFSLNLNTPSFGFSENALNDGETSAPLSFDGGDSNTIYVNIPKESIITTATIQLTGTPRFARLFACSNSCQNSSCTASNPSSAVDWSCSYNVAASADGASYDSSHHLEGNVWAGDSSCSFNYCASGFRQSIPPQSCTGGSYACNPGESIQASWTTAPNGFYHRAVDVCHPDHTWGGTNSLINWGGGTVDVALDYSYTMSELANSPTPAGYTLCEAGDTSAVTDTPQYPTPTLDVNADGVDWSHGSIIISATPVTITSYLQSALSACSTDICTIPLQFNSITPGTLLVDSINIQYAYTPTSIVSTKTSWSQITNIQAGESYYKADQITFTNNPAQDLTIKYWDVDETATQCWVDGVERSILTVSGNKVCDIEDLNIPANGALPSSKKFWTDEYERGVPVSISESEYTQDTSKETTAGGAAYIQSTITLSNAESFGESISGFWNVSPRENWDCDSCDGAFTIASGESSQKVSAQYRTNVITIIEDTREQDPTKTSTLETQYAQKVYTITNADTLTYTDVAWLGEEDWGDCDLCSGVINVLSAGQTELRTARFHGSQLSASWTNWVQDSAFASTDSVQYVKNDLIVGNADADISFSNIPWSITAPSNFTCSTCSGSLTIPASSTTQQIATALGDSVTAAFSLWEQDHSKTTTAGGYAYKRQNFTVSNGAAIQFTNIALSIASDESWSCDSIPSISAPASSSNTYARTCNASNIIMIVESEWAQDENQQSTIDAQYISKTINGFNLGDISFTNVAWSVSTSKDWNDILTEGTFNISKGGSINVFASAQGNVLVWAWTNWTQDSAFTSTDSTQYVKNDLIVENIDADIGFSNIDWSIIAPTGFNCNACNGSLNIPASSTIQNSVQAYGDSINLSFSSWVQDSDNVTVAGGTAYKKQEIEVSNNAAIEFNPLTISVPGDSTWFCSDIPTFSAPSSGSNSYTRKCSADNIVTLSASEWSQDLDQISTTSVQYITNKLSGVNTINVSFTNVAWSASAPTGWIGITINGTVDLIANDAWSVNATAEGRRITKTETGWAENNSYPHTLDQQGLQNMVTLKNTDSSIDFQNIQWAVTCLEGWNCTQTNGSTDLILRNNGEWTADLGATNDVLDGSYTNWTQDDSKQSTGITQYLKRILTIQNNENIAFTTVSWENTDAPNGFTCDTCSGTLSISAQGSPSTMLTSDGNSLETTTTPWAQDSSQTTTAGGLAFIQQNYTITNNGTIGFTNIVYDLTGREGWGCLSTATVSVDDQSTASPVQYCNKSNAITFSTTGWMQDLDQSSTTRTQYIKNTVQGVNNADIDFSNVSWSVSTLSGWDAETGATGVVNIVAGSAWNVEINTSVGMLTECSAWVWAADHAATHTFTEQYLAGSCQVLNNGTISFSNVTWSVSAPEGWTGSNLTGVVSIENGSNTGLQSSSKGNVLTYTNLWVQDMNETHTLAEQHLKNKVVITNNDNYTFIINYTRDDFSAVPFGTCSDCTGTLSVAPIGASMELHASGNALTIVWSDWAQDDGIITSELQPIQKTLTVSNSIGINLDNITWVATAPTWGGTTGTCEICDGDLRISPGGASSTTATATGSWITITEELWEENTEQTQTLEEQNVKKKVTLTNNAEIPFTSVKHNENNYSWNCIDCAITSGVLEANGLLTSNEEEFMVHATMDVLHGSYENWEQDDSKESNLTLQHLARNLTIQNSGNVSFTAIPWENTSTPTDFTCTNCEGTLSIPALETKSTQLTSSGNVLEATLSDWVQEAIEETIAGEPVHIARSLIARNSFTSNLSVTMHPDRPKGWTCSFDTETIIPTGESVINRVINCSASPVVLRVSTRQTVNANAPEDEPLHMHKTIVIENNGFMPFTTPVRLSLGNPVTNSLRVHNETQELNNTSWELTGNTIDWVLSMNATASRSFHVYYDVQEKLFQKPPQLREENGVYLYELNLTLAEVDNETVIKLNIPASALTSWDRHTQLTIQINGNVFSNFTDTPDGLTLIIPAADFMNRSFDSNSALAALSFQSSTPDEMLPVLVRYTLQKGCTSNCDDNPSPSTGGGGGGGGGTPRKPKEEPTKEIGPEVIVIDESTIVTTIDEPIAPIVPSVPDNKVTGFAALIQKLRHPRAVGLIAGLMLAALIGVQIQRGNVNIPKIQMPKVQLPRRRKPIVPKKRTEPILNVETPQSTLEEPKKINSTTEAIMSGLTEREQEIVQVLLENEGETTQARIYHATGISTSALTRWMNTLEQKGLIESSRIGKLRKVKLTEKFSG